MTNEFLVDKLDSTKIIIHFILSNDQPILPLRKTYTKYRSIAITVYSELNNFHNIHFICIFSFSCHLSRPGPPEYSSGFVIRLDGASAFPDAVNGCYVFIGYIVLQHLMHDYAALCCKDKQLFYKLHPFIHLFLHTFFTWGTSKRICFHSYFILLRSLSLLNL